MSEYQFYEFKAVDQPLSESDKKEIGSWSSRTNPTNAGAVFTYSYSNFPKDEMKVVEKYFDAMFYISNWGTTRLVFKFPNSLIDVGQLKPYCFPEKISLIEKTDFTLLDIYISDDENGRWIEGDGWLDSLVPLRNDILSGDYRCLYLIWLKVSTEDVLNEEETIDPESKEPPVPHDLKSLNGALGDFAEIFEIAKDAIAVAAEKSIAGTPGSGKDYSAFIGSLPIQEKDEFLFRLLNNEPLLNVKLKNRLKDFIPEEKEHHVEKRRTVRELTEAIKDVKEGKKKEEQKKREEKRLAKLKETEQQQYSLWNTVERLIKEKNSSSYDEAVKVLQDLKELAIHKKQLNDFVEKIETIIKTHSNLSGLRRRIEQGNLTKK